MKKILVAACFGLTFLSARAQQKFADLGLFRLENGQSVQHCRVGYRTFGHLNTDRSNAILIPTWFGGTSEQKSSLANPGGLADSARFFVIVVDALGNGVSSSPSNSPAQANGAFPVISVRDMVNSQYELVTRHLKLSHLYAVMGISMGGMQSFQWAVSYPTFMDKVVPIIGTPRQSVYDKLFWNTQLNTLERGNYSAEAMKTVGALHELNLWTPAAHVDKRKTDEYAGYIADTEKRYAEIQPYDWACQLRAMLGQDVAPGETLEAAAKKVKAKMMIVVATQDHMVNPAAATQFANAIGAPLVELTGPCGHMATSCESAKIAAFVRSFLQ